MGLAKRLGQVSPQVRPSLKKRRSTNARFVAQHAAFAALRGGGSAKQLDMGKESKYVSLNSAPSDIWVYAIADTYVTAPRAWQLLKRYSWRTLGSMRSRTPPSARQHNRQHHAPTTRTRRARRTWAVPEATRRNRTQLARTNLRARIAGPSAQGVSDNEVYPYIDVTISM